MRALHARLQAHTASFRHPLVISGTQVSLPMPGYTNLLGMLSACVGDFLLPRDVRVGFEYGYRCRGLDLQTTTRLTLVGRGRLQPHPKGSGILRREFHVGPTIELYIVSERLADIESGLLSPVEAPRFGRSEDLAWICFVRQIDLAPVSVGSVAGTLLAEGATDAIGLPLTLTEWFEQPKFDRPRRPGSVSRFVALPPAVGLRYRVSGRDLFRASDAPSEDSAVYVHQWTRRSDS
jgi:CRISPR-associated Cas5-like protein